MKKRKHKGQTAIEYTILFVIIIGSFLAIQNYLKRGLQGRWKDSIDDLGDQYDPRTAVTDGRHTLTSNTNTTIRAYNVSGGFWTQRIDDSASTERRTGSTAVGAY